MSDSTKDLAIRLGAAFGSIAESYIPMMERFIKYDTAERPSFSAKVEIFWDDKHGKLRGRITNKPPKVPVKQPDTVEFDLELDEQGAFKFPE